MARLTLSDNDQPKGLEAKREKPSPKGRTYKAQSSLISSPVGLTDKQEHFAQLVASGLPQVKAYREAYDCKNPHPQSSHVQASRLAKVAKVKERINHLRMVKANQDWQDMTKMRGVALQVLHDEARGFGPDTKSSSRVAAAVAIGKIRDIDLFADHKVVEHRDDARLDELKSKLEQRLKAYFSPDPIALTRQSGADEPENAVVTVGDPPPEGGTPV